MYVIKVLVKHLLKNKSIILKILLQQNWINSDIYIYYKMKKNFAVDSKNIGGMKMLNDNMFLHHKALINAKPAISIKPPRPVIS